MEDEEPRRNTGGKKPGRKTTVSDGKKKKVNVKFGDIRRTAKEERKRGVTVMPKKKSLRNKEKKGLRKIWQKKKGLGQETSR